MTQTNTSKAHNNVAWKIETTWGNQANYADKVKRIGGELISRIRTWIMEQETFIEGRNPAEFVTAQPLRDDFAILRASSDTEEFEQEYHSLLRALKKVCHGEKMLRTNAWKVDLCFFFVTTNSLSFQQGFLFFPVDCDTAKSLQLRSLSSVSEVSR